MKPTSKQEGGRPGFLARLAELLVPVLILAWGTSYYLEARALPRPETNLLLVEPVFLILLACCLLFAAGRCLAWLRREGEEEAEEGDAEGREPLQLGKSLGFVVLTVAYVGLLDVVGFVVTSLAYMVALALLLGVRSLPLLILVPGAVVAILYLGMAVWLNLPPPAGFLV